MPEPTAGEAPQLQGDFLLDDARDDVVNMRSVKGHQHGNADAASGGADSSPLEERSTDERATTPDVERMDTPDENLGRK